MRCKITALPDPSEQALLYISGQALPDSSVQPPLVFRRYDWAIGNQYV